MIHSTAAAVLGKQGWPSGEDTCLPPMWPGIDSQTWLVVYSAARGFFCGMGTRRAPLLRKYGNPSMREILVL